jgi:hypothetical protein
MSANNKIETIYIELDCLLDSRLGTIRRMGVEHAERVLTPGYLTREIDEFDGIDSQEFKKLYEARDVETLKHSSITALVTRLKDLTTFLSELAIARPYFNGIQIALNVHPYRFDNEELKELRQCVSVWTGGLVPVELINIPPAKLTPIYVKSNFSMLFMYDLDGWVQKQQEALNETRLPEIHLVAPALYVGEKPDEKTLKELIRTAAHPFQATTMLAIPFFGLELIDIKFFSIAQLHRKTTPA